MFALALPTYRDRIDSAMSKASRGSLSSSQKVTVIVEAAKLIKGSRKDTATREDKRCGAGWISDLKKCHKKPVPLASRGRKGKKKRGRPQGKWKIAPGSVGEMDPAEIGVDPETFQYKRLSNAAGEVGSLSGVKNYDPNLAGIIQTWRSPADGKTYVVNGHNRLALAKRANAAKVAVRMLDVSTAKEARAVGALTNIAEGRGDALDSAKFFRDSGITKEDLLKKGIPLREKVASDGLSISKLAAPLYRKAMSGDLPVERAAIIGKANLAEEQQTALYSLVEKRSKRREISNAVLNELIDVAKTSATQTQTTLSLFGAEEVKQSLMVEKASLQAGIKRRLGREKRLFGTVGKQKSAKALARGGNQINAERSQEISKQANLALMRFEKLKGLTGDVSTAINEGARRLAAGESQRTVEADLYKQVLAQVRTDSAQHAAAYRNDALAFIDAIARRQDSKRTSVLIPTPRGRVKRPGKPCGKSYIRAAYKCQSHFTNGKLNAEGKAARKKYADILRTKRAGGKPKAKQSDLEWLKANPLNTQTSQGTAKEWQRRLKNLSKEDRRKFFDESRAARTKSRRSASGKKGAQTRKRRAAEKDARLKELQSTPEGREVLAADEALNKLSDRTGQPWPGAIKDGSYDKAVDRQQHAQDKLKVANALRSPTAKQRAYDDAQPEFNLETGNGKTEAYRVKGTNQRVAGNRMSDAEATGIPWTIDVYPHSDRAYTLAGAKIEPYSDSRDHRSIRLMGTDTKYGHFRIYYPKGDAAVSRRARRLVQQIGEGKSVKGMTLVDMKEQIYGGPVPHNLGLSGTSYETESNKERSQWQKAQAKKAPALTLTGAPAAKAAKAAPTLAGKRQANLFGGVEAIPKYTGAGKNKGLELTTKNLNQVSGQERIKFAQQGLKAAREGNDTRKVQQWVKALSDAQKQAFAQTRAEKANKQADIFGALGETEFSYDKSTPLFSQ